MTGDTRADTAAAPAATDAVSPLVLTARLDPGLSNWGWLAKWIVAIPHLIVLAVLWVAFAVGTVMAGLAIVATASYPRALFDFNVGVLRWTWRVWHFAFFGGIGTDRYPPFSLVDDPDYPARLTVAHPDRLSRRLVLVKWWLLAIPHYLIVIVMVGGSVRWLLPGTDLIRFDRADSGGLLGLLVLLAGVILLLTGRYPRPLFDLVIGLNRWIYRVVAYAALLTDRYPPFRLDQGGEEPAVHGGPSR
jgi:hypothetical protein